MSISNFADHSGSLTASTSLVRRVKSQDQDAWRRLVGIYGPLVYRWARRAGLQAADAEDIVGEVFAGVLRAVERFLHDGFSDHGQLGSYRLLEKLGGGGMGTVYKALHTKLDRVVAVKVLNKTRLNDADAVGRFEREMKAVGRLVHPHIVHATDAGHDGGVAYLVMEFVDGMDLSKLGRRLGPLPVAEACELIRQAAVGLECVHEHGLVHRDIKPSNLMLAGIRSQRPDASKHAHPTSCSLTPDSCPLTPVVKILDLGLALLGPESGERELTSTGQVMGTIDYMAPEQFEDTHGVDIRADVYSLGATAYKLLTGHAPFSSEKYGSSLEKIAALARDAVPSVATHRDDLPAKLVNVVDRMLARDPADRLQTPQDVAEAIAPFAGAADLMALWNRAQSVSDSKASVPQTLIPRKSVAAPEGHRHTKAIAGWAVALLVVIGFFAVWAANHFRRQQTSDVSAANEPQPVPAKTRVPIGLTLQRTEQPFCLGHTVGVAFADLDDDGDQDAVVASYGNGPDQVWLNDGQGQFEKLRQSFPETHCFKVLLGDLDRDLDLVFAAKNGAIQILLNDGSGRFPDRIDLLSEPGIETGLALADVDGDGDVDLFVGYADKNDSIWFHQLVPTRAGVPGDAVHVFAKDPEGVAERSEGHAPGKQAESAPDASSPDPAGPTAGPPMLTLANGWQIGEPVNLGPMVNSQWNDADPAVTADGSTLLFSSSRPGESDGLWISTRAGIGEPWGEPVNLGPQVNTTTWDAAPAFAQHDAALYFSSRRPKGDGQDDGDIDIWMVPVKRPEPRGKATTKAEHREPPDRAIAPFGEQQAKALQKAWADHLGQPVEFENSVGMKVRLIPPGMYTMGSPEDEPGRQDNEPQCRVTLTRPFYLGATEATKAQFGQFVRETDYETTAEQDGFSYRWDLTAGGHAEELGISWRNPKVKQVKDDYDRPVVDVTWLDSVAFCDWLSGNFHHKDAMLRSANRESTASVRRPRNETIGFRVLLEIVEESASAATDALKRSEPHVTPEQAESEPPELRRGLVAHWKLDGDARDCAENGLHGAIVGDATFVSGHVGSGALKLDGGSMSVPHHDKLNGGNPMSVTAWVNLPAGVDQGPWPPVINKGGPSWRLEMSMSSDPGDFAFAIDDHAKLRSVRSREDAKYLDGAWHHLAGVLDGKTMMIYVDGKEEGRRSWPEPVVVNQNTDALRMGARVDYRARRLVGMIDDVRVYERALTADEIRALATR